MVASFGRVSWFDFCLICSLHPWRERKFSRKTHCSNTTKKYTGDSHDPTGDVLWRIWRLPQQEHMSRDEVGCRGHPSKHFSPYHFMPALLTHIKIIQAWKKKQSAQQAEPLWSTVTKILGTGWFFLERNQESSSSKRERTVCHQENRTTKGTNGTIACDSETVWNRHGIILIVCYKKAGEAAERN